MSLHAQLTPEAKARLAAQKRNSTISSVIISMLTVLLIGIILMLFLLPSVDTFTPEIVSYQSGKDDDEQQQKRVMNRQVQPKPSSPSSSMAKVIAANTVSEIAVPVPETTADVSLNLGNGDDFGDGWGDGDGWGSGGGTTFFGTTVKAKRVVFVIDYSASMGGKRIALLKAELTKSVGKLYPETQYQMIFFAGPAWLAGDKVKMAGKASAVVVHGKKQFKWVSPKKSAHSWNTVGNVQPAEWVDVTDSQIKKSLGFIKSTKLVWGTAWQKPLEMALNMKPAPEVIFFMTDGLAGGNSEAVAQKIAARAKAKKIQINTIAMMEPRAAKAMQVMAKTTGGKSTMVGADGKAKQLK